MIHEEFFKFYDVLTESRVYATRHLSVEEKIGIVDYLKKCIKEGKADIAYRDKNYLFMNKYHLSSKEALEFIDMCISSRDVICTLNNKNKENDELYLCVVKVPKSKLFVYLKFRINEDGGVDIISFHDNSEKKYIDYSYASDYKDNSFNEILMKKIIFNYNKFNNKNKITNSYCDAEKGTLIFEFNDEVDKDTKFGIYKSFPKDMGLDNIRMLKSFDTESDYKKITFKVYTRSYDNIHKN